MRHLPLSAVEVIRMRHSDPCLLQSLDSSWNKMQQTATLNLPFSWLLWHFKAVLRNVAINLIAPLYLFPFEIIWTWEREVCRQERTLKWKESRIDTRYHLCARLPLWCKRGSISQRISWRRAFYKEKVKRKFRKKKKKKINRRRSCRLSCMSYF